MAASLVLLLSAALAQSPQTVEVPAFDPPFRSREDLANWFRAHVPVAAELPWVTRPWNLDLANGVEQAWRESKPLAIWLGDGHPFGAASASALLLKPAWSDSALRAASRGFVLVADDWHELSAARATNPSLDLWLRRLEGDVPLTAGCVAFAAQDGSALGRCAASSSEELSAAFAAAAAVWREEGAALSPSPSPAERPGPFTRFHRRSDSFPLAGLALELTSRGCGDPADGAPEWLETSWNRDWFWIGAEDLQVLLPRSGGLGASIVLPPNLALPLAGLILADSSQGRIAPFAAEEILHARFVAEPRAVRRGLRGYQLSGELLAARGGLWKSESEDVLAAGQWSAKGVGDVRARARLTGWMEVETASRRILALQFGALVQTVDAGGIQHHLALARQLDAIEDSARLVPSQLGAAFLSESHDERGSLPRRYRMLYAESAPSLDGSLDEPVWMGSPWSEEIGSGARTKLLWNAELLFFGVWSPQPTVELRAQGVTITIASDGAVTGLDSARAFRREHEGGWCFEVALPWSALTHEEGLATPHAGSFAAVNLRAGGTDAAWWSIDASGDVADAIVLLEPSHSINFTPGGGFR